MKNFLKKLGSRKFILAVVGVAVGICAIFGIDGGAIETVAGAVTAAGSAIAYICAEGKIDAEDEDSSDEDDDDANDDDDEDKKKKKNLFTSKLMVKMLVYLKVKWVTLKLVT